MSPSGRYVRNGTDPNAVTCAVTIDRGLGGERRVGERARVGHRGGEEGGGKYA